MKKTMNFLLILMVLSVLGGCKQAPVASTTQPDSNPTTVTATSSPDNYKVSSNSSTGIPVNVAVEIDHAPLIGESAVISWTVSSAWDMPLVYGVLELSDGLQLTDGDASWQGSLAAGGKQTLFATITVLSEGILDIRGVVKTEPQGGDSWSNVAHLYLTVTQDGSFVGLSEGGQAEATQVP
jgi:hypothetical protein